jgi:hypothetical protein
MVVGIISRMIILLELLHKDDSFRITNGTGFSVILLSRRI